MQLLLSIWCWLYHVIPWFVNLWAKFVSVVHLVAGCIVQSCCSKSHWCLCCQSSLLVLVALRGSIVPQIVGSILSHRAVVYRVLCLVLWFQKVEAPILLSWLLGTGLVAWILGSSTSGPYTVVLCLVGYWWCRVVLSCQMSWVPMLVICFHCTRFITWVHVSSRCGP